MGRPLLVLEALRVDYPFASDRLHTYVLQGMADNAEAFGRAGVTYWPYVEPAPGAGRGLLEALAAHACLVVTDDTPVFFLPRMIAATARRLGVRLLGVDGSGLLPVRAIGGAPATAHAFRRFLQRALPPHLTERPEERPRFPRLPTNADVPRGVARRWPETPASRLRAPAALVARLPIDHDVAPVAERGGFRAAHQRLSEFLRDKLPRYAAERAHPDADVTSRLSAYLHFGHVSVHEVFWVSTGSQNSPGGGSEISSPQVDSVASAGRTRPALSSSLSR